MRIWTKIFGDAYNKLAAKDAKTKGGHAIWSERLGAGARVKFYVSARISISMSSTTSRRKRKSHSTDDAKASAKKPRKVLASNQEDEEFHVIKASLILPISPVFANDPRAGVEEMLDSMVMR